MSTPTEVLSVENNKQYTVQWHTLLYRLIIKYNLSCILVEHLDIEMSMFDLLLMKRDEKTRRRNSKNKDLHIPFSDLAFGRLMASEHYSHEWKDQLEYRQIRGHEMVHFSYELQRSSSPVSLPNGENSL